MKGRVLITGASSGIGRALAVRFAKAGHDLVLVARNRAALEVLAADLARDHGTEVTVIDGDLSEQSSVDRTLGRLAASGLDIDVLVNNAGFGIHGRSPEIDLALETRLVHLQIDAMLALTKAVLPGMLARDRGSILNVASVYSFAPAPFQATYGACKAFIYAYSASLAEELRGSGVTVTVVAPGSTRTAFRQRAGIRGPDDHDSGMSADAVAYVAYEALMSGRHLVIPGLHNRLFVLLMRIIPRAFHGRLVRRINRVRGVDKG